VLTLDICHLVKWEAKKSISHTKAARELIKIRFEILAHMLFTFSSYTFHNIIILSSGLIRLFTPLNYCFDLGFSLSS